MLAAHNIDTYRCNKLVHNGQVAGNDHNILTMLCGPQWPCQFSPCIQAAPTEVHTLPDGQNITIEGEGQQLAQAILTPMMLNKDLPDLPAATVTQIMQHPDAATRKVPQCATCINTSTDCAMH